jgi:HK97 family phage major capsid protein
MRDLDTLEREVSEYRAEARAILDRAGGSDLAGDDAARFDQLAESIESHNGEIRGLQERRRQIELVRSAGQPGSRAKLEGEAEGINPYGGDEADRPTAHQQRDTTTNRRLAFTAEMATDVSERMLTDLGNNVRALATSGSVVVGQEFRPDPVALGKPANSLLDVLPVLQHTQPEFAYMRQSVRTNNAAVVAEGAVKPTSVYTVVRIEDKLDVVAHLSEAVPRYWFVDNPSLQQFLVSEMQYGLRTAVEAMVLSDINGTSGTQTQAYSTSVLTTLRKSITKLETSGLDASFILLNVADWEAVELALSSTNAIEHLSLPYDPATRRLFGVPIVSSIIQAAGVSHTVAAGAVGVDTDSRGVAVEWSETSNADDWSKNLIRCRVEGRFATSVFRPLGVVVGDLTA